jgi:hypothetical protein
VAAAPHPPHLLLLLLLLLSALPLLLLVSLPESLSLLPPDSELLSSRRLRFLRDDLDLPCGPHRRRVSAAQTRARHHAHMVHQSGSTHMKVKHRPAATTRGPQALSHPTQHCWLPHHPEGGEYLPRMVRVFRPRRAVGTGGGGGGGAWC